MAFSSYAALKSAVASWASRSDLTTQIVDFIDIAESRIEKEMPIRLKEVDSTLTATPSSRQIALPSGFVDWVGLWNTYWGGEDEQLPFVSQGDIDYDATEGPPSAWTISGGYIEFDQPADQAYTFRFRYRKGLDVASDDANTLAFLAANPNVYLFGALAELHAFTKDFDQSAVFEQKFQRALGEARRSESRDMVGPLRVDAAIRAAGSFDINRGD